MDSNFKNNLTERHGNLVENDNFSLTDAQTGNIVLGDVHLVEKLAHFNRERIPERVVHAKGAGAHGEFVVTRDMTHICCADFLSKIGKKTEIFIRFSTVGGEKGSADSVRDPRGFAVKFYTEEGNLDIVGNNTPVFFIRDPIKFPDFIHTQKRNPNTNLPDPNAFWDFLSINAESIHQVCILFSDRGTPLGFRHMHGFGTNTFMWYNEKKEFVYIKIHFRTQQEIKNFNEQESVEMAGTNPNYAVQDLREAIDNKKYPKWKMYVQIMTEAESKTYKFNPFDTTKVWYYKDFPLHEVGELTLNRNPTNFFEEVEQAAFCPANFVRGITFSPDKMLQGRMFAYSDAQRYRIGANSANLEINKPKNAKVITYQSDADFAIHNKNFPNYFPNSYDNTVTDEKLFRPSFTTAGKNFRYNVPITDVDFEQANALYTRVLTPIERDRLISNICGNLKNANYLLQYRQTALFYKVEPDFGTRVANDLGLDLECVMSLANMTNEERVKHTQRKYSD